MYHAIEGTVGCGKSTTLNLLKLSNLKAIYYDEPYQAFCHFLSYNPLFEVCKDMQANARFAQLHILHSSCAHYPKKNDHLKEVLISKRSMISPLVFIEAMFSLGTFSSFCSDYLRCKLFLMSIMNRIPDHIIFLNLNLLYCWQQTLLRNRHFEQNYTLEYHQILNQYYLECLGKLKNNRPDMVLTIIEVNPSQSKQEIAHLVCEHIEKVEKQCSP